MSANSATVNFPCFSVSVLWDTGHLVSVSLKGRGSSGQTGVTPQGFVAAFYRIAAVPTATEG